MPEEKAVWHQHDHVPPGRPPTKVFGRRLQEGDVIQDRDVYASTSGQWHEAPVTGITVGALPGVYWVRPCVEPTEEEVLPPEPGE